VCVVEQEFTFKQVSSALTLVSSNCVVWFAPAYSIHDEALQKQVPVS
jgi:hypothetical protein